MLWAQQKKVLLPSLYCVGSCNLRDRYLKSWQINSAWLDITRGESEKYVFFISFFFFCVNWMNLPFNTDPLAPNTATWKAPLYDSASVVLSCPRLTFSPALGLSFFHLQKQGRVQVRLPTSETAIPAHALAVALATAQWAWMGTH